MSALWTPPTDRVAELRDAFDRSFAEAPSEADAREDLLHVRLGAATYSLRLTEISGVFADMIITPLPSPVPALLGLVGLRGAILPVYDLRAMLGYVVEAKPRWLAIAEGISVGLAFDGFEGHIRVAREAILPSAGGEARIGHVREVVRLDTGSRPIISVASVLEAITNRVRLAAPEKE